MSLLKEGDGVNFQKASCTLDGCVKIYTSRVDSVATDTGKLLSGLAEKAKMVRMERVARRSARRGLPGRPKLPSRLPLHNYRTRRWSSSFQ